MSSTHETVYINHVPVDRELVEMALKELKSRKFYYIRQIEKGKNQGIRDASVKRLEKLDNLTALMRKSIDQ